MITWIELDFKPKGSGYEEEAGGGSPMIYMDKMGPRNLYRADQRIFTGHCSFQFTNGHAKKVSKVEGVDIVNPLSRYSFRLAIGCCFDPERVKKSVERAINPTSADIRKDLITEYASIITPFWFVVEDDDSKINLYKAKSTKDIDVQLDGRKAWARSHTS